MKQLSLLVLVLSFAITTPVTAADKDGSYWQQGDISCGEWVKRRKKEDMAHLSLIFWIGGYITAHNSHKPDVYNILGSTDMESVLLWMDKYCQDNPLNGLAVGMDVLTEELWPNRKRTKHD